MRVVSAFPHTVAIPSHTKSSEILQVWPMHSPHQFYTRKPQHTWKQPGLVPVLKGTHTYKDQGLKHLKEHQPSVSWGQQVLFTLHRAPALLGHGQCSVLSALCSALSHRQCSVLSPCLLGVSLTHPGRILMFRLYLCVAFFIGLQASGFYKASSYI